MHKLCGVILPILVIVFALWETMYSKWILVVVGVLMLLHPFICKNPCKAPVGKVPKAKKPLKKKRR